MRKILNILILSLAAAMISSCASQKRAWYLQDAQPANSEQIIQNGQIRIKPLDRLTVVISSKDPELAVPFNAWSTYSSLSGTTSGGTGQQSLQVLTVDENGRLDMPLIGAIECKGMTRSELQQTIAKKIIDAGYISQPSVNVQFANMKIALLGEVARPGEYQVTHDRVSIFDALAMAGDITIYGVRTDVAVARETDGVRTIYYLDLTSKEAFNSPVYYLQQNDMVYIKPNKAKVASGEINQNRTFYLSLIGTAISVATLIITLTR